MKYGVIYFRETENLGDDIQTYAALRFLPSVDYVIEREKLSSFTPNKNEYVKVIMNGWFNHDVTALPPSPFIKPLYISSHFTDHLLEKKPDYFSNYFVEYLRANMPIGLRDDLVKPYLDEENIDNYYSGCLTLTINKFKNIRRNNKICLVDVDEDIKNKIISKYKKENVIIRTHTLNSMTNSKLSFEERMNNVEETLKTYQASDVVITSRLHVALPCLAIGEPVILIYDDSNVDVTNRLSKYTNYLNYYSKTKFLKNPKIDVKNGNGFKQIRSSLEDKVNKFINDDKILKCSEDVDYYKKYYVYQKEHIDKINQEVINGLKERIGFVEKEYQKLSLINEFYTKESKIRKEAIIRVQDSYDSVLAQLNAIRYSRSYKIYSRIKRFLKKFSILRRIRNLLKR